MSIKFETVKELNINNMKLIPIKTNDDKQVFVKTNKCFSFGVKKDKRFKSISMSLVLDEGTTKTLKDIVDQCESHLSHSLTKSILRQRRHYYLSKIKAKHEILRDQR